MTTSELLAQPSTPAALAVAGLLLLVFGRRLFWFFLGLAGAVAALILAERVFGFEPGLPSLVAAIAVGIVGAVLAILVQKAMVALVGFATGLWAALYLLEAFSRPVEPELLRLAVVLLAGILGAILAARLFEAALVVITSLAGAALLVLATGLQETGALVAFTALAGLGLVIQWRASRPTPRKSGG